MRKIGIRILVCLCILITIASVSTLFFILKKPNNLYLSAGDDFSGIPLYSKDKKMELDYSKDNLIFYLSASCATCIEDLQLISFFDKYLNLKDISFNIVWENNIPENMITKYNFLNINNYSLKNKTLFNGSTPFFYIINKKKTVEFATNNIDDLIMMINNDKSQNDKIIFDILTKSITSKQPSLVFLTENCEACNDLKNELINNENAEEKYVFISDYQIKDFSIYDKWGFFCKIFNVKTFPAIVFYENDNIIVSNDLESLH
jgi:hypothetical protein